MMPLRFRKISPQSDLKVDSILLKYNDIVEYGHYRFSFGKELLWKNIQEVFVHVNRNFTST